MPISPADLDRVLDALAARSHIALDDAVEPTLLAALRQRMHGLSAEAFHRAGVGRQHDHGLAPAFRSDRIHWLEHSDPAEEAWLSWADDLRQRINAELFMGLHSYEAHFAHYAPGQRYGRHVDAFRGQANRVLSTVLYLNDAWDADDGGELLMYADPSCADASASLLPQPGRLVVFLSEDLPHEVRPAQRDRYSIAGWFRVRSGPLD